MSSKLMKTNQTVDYNYRQITPYAPYLLGESTDESQIKQQSKENKASAKYPCNVTLGHSNL